MSEVRNKKRFDTYEKYKDESESLFKQMMRENKGLRHIVKEAKIYRKEYMIDWKKLHPEKIKQYTNRIVYSKKNKCPLCGKNIVNNSKHCNNCKFIEKRKQYTVETNKVNYIPPQGSSLPVPTVNDNSPKQ